MENQMVHLTIRACCLGTMIAGMIATKKLKLGRDLFLGFGIVATLTTLGTLLALFGII